VGGAGNSASPFPRATSAACRCRRPVPIRVLCSRCGRTRYPPASEREETRRPKDGCQKTKPGDGKPQEEAPSETFRQIINHKSAIINPSVPAGTEELRSVQEWSLQPLYPCSREAGKAGPPGKRTGPSPPSAPCGPAPKPPGISRVSPIAREQKRSPLLRGLARKGLRLRLGTSGYNAGGARLAGPASGLIRASITACLRYAIS
jgi:hypothetical protein